MQLTVLHLLPLLGLASAQQAFKFMPLGDSITEQQCWRAYVWDQLAEAGLTGNIDFVGSMSNNWGNCVSQDPNFDLDHEGHSGWQAGNIADQYLAGWLATYQPNLVNFHLGTNDITAGRSADDILGSFTQLVNLMRASNPNIRIIVDALIPLVPNQAVVDELNGKLEGWRQSLDTPESPIVIVDVSLGAGFSTDFLYDGIHPNDAGDQFIASKIGPALINIIQSMIASEA